MWPASGPEEHIHAAAKRPNVTEELADLPPDRKVFTVSKWFARDLPYDWTVRTHMRAAGRNIERLINVVRSRHEDRHI